MAAGREYELKFELEPPYIERLLAHSRMPAPDRTLRMQATYFDTEQDVLRQHGVSLRVRRAGDTITQTAKRQGVSSIDREEWEQENGETAPDLAWLRRTPLKPLFKKDGPVAMGLSPRFTVDVERSVFTLSHDGSDIEGALDLGRIHADGRSTPMHEFELELKRGRRRAVLKLARELSRDVPITLSLATKSERGYRLVESKFGQPTKAFPLKLKKRMGLAEAFESITQSCLRLLLTNTAPHLLTNTAPHRKRRGHGGRPQGAYRAPADARSL